MTNDKITIIGIAGGTGSGKTTVVKKIVEALPPHHVAVVPLDSYYNDTTGMTDEERHAINFDHPDAFDWKLLIKQIGDLRAGKAIEQPTYSYLICNRLPETIHVEPKPVIIIEGIMALINRRLRDMMDIKIFVETDADVRILSRALRDVEERGRSLESVVTQYLTTVKPMHELYVEPSKKNAHIIVPEGGKNLIALEMIINRIQRHIDASAD